jgi:hypothetical protein
MDKKTLLEEAKNMEERWEMFLLLHERILPFIGNLAAHVAN